MDAHGPVKSKHEKSKAEAGLEHRDSTIWGCVQAISEILCHTLMHLTGLGVQYSTVSITEMLRRTQL